jgi:hypothetical protein
MDSGFDISEELRSDETDADGDPFVEYLKCREWGKRQIQSGGFPYITL